MSFARRRQWNTNNIVTLDDGVSNEMVTETLETIKKRMENNPDQFLLEILPLWRRYQYKSKRREVNADNLEKNKISSSNIDQHSTVNCNQSIIPLVNSSHKTDVTFTVTDCVQDSSFNSQDREEEDDDDDDIDDDNEELLGSSTATAAAAASTATVANTSSATNDMQSNGRQNANTEHVSVHENKRKRKNVLSSVSSKQRSIVLNERMMKVDYNTMASSSSLNMSGNYSKEINSLSDKSINHTRRLESKMLLNTGNNSSNNTSGHLTDAEALLAQMHPMHQRYHLLQPDLMTGAFPAAASAAAIAAAGLPTAFPFDLYRCLGSLYSPSNDRN